MTQRGVLPRSIIRLTKPAQMNVKGFPLKVTELDLTLLLSLSYTSLEHDKERSLTWSCSARRPLGGSLRTRPELECLQKQSREQLHSHASLCS